MDSIHYASLMTRALENAASAVFLCDSSGKIVWVNDAFCRMSGYPPEELLGHTPGLLRSGGQSPLFYRQLWQTILSGSPWQGELLERGKNAAFYRVSQVITPLLDESGAISHFLAIQHDITQLAQEHERMRQLAWHDGLTGLPNRLLFLQTLQHAIEDAEVEAWLLAVLFIDLDGFKGVNDRYGHAAGDQLLQAVAERLQAGVRKSDLVARLGGDELTVLVQRLEHESQATALAEQLLATLRRPFAVTGQTLQLNASIGIALYPRDGNNEEQLLAAADAAMYRVKRTGGNACAR